MSIVDVSFEDIDVPSIKILRLLRILRPLRFISKNSDLKTIVICLLESVGHIFNVVIVVCIVWLMFAILGVSLFGGKFFYCSVDIYQMQTEIECEKNRGTWQAYDYNFDNTLNAMQLLFVISTFENWISIMY